MITHRAANVAAPTPTIAALFNRPSPNTQRYPATRPDTMRLGTKWVLIPKIYTPPGVPSPLVGFRV